MNTQQLKQQFAQSHFSPGPSAPEPGTVAPDLLWRGKGSGAKGLRKRLMQLGAHNAFLAQAPLWEQIGTLQQQANTNRFSSEGRANFLAPRMEALNRSMQQAGSALTRDLAERGIEQSSAGVNALTGLAARGAEAKAGLVNQLYQAEEGRQLQAQALLRDLLMSLQGRNSQQALSAANAITQFQQQQQQIDAANRVGWEDAMRGAMGLAGSYLGGLHGSRK